MTVRMAVGLMIRLLKLRFKSTTAWQTPSKAPSWGPCLDKLQAAYTQTYREFERYQTPDRPSGMSGSFQPPGLACMDRPTVLSKL